MEPSDTDLLNWLEKQPGYGLINDDFGHWAVSGDGMQNVPKDVSIPNDIQTTFFIEAKDWYPTIREAIKAAMPKKGE